MRFPNRFMTCLYITFCCTVLPRAEGTLRHIQGDSSATDLINVVLLAEGYTEAQEKQFTDHATALIADVLTNPPYKHYAATMNFWSIFVASNESGADHPLDNIVKDTYFNATFGTSTERLVTFSNKTAAYDLLAEHVPDYDIVCLIVNDTQYGGSGGGIAVATVNSSSTGLFLHETGHSFALLGDEYESAYTLSPSEKYNVTAKTEREQISWSAWILDETPVPTPETSEYSAMVGLFEGAMYQPEGWYRPKLICMMRSLSSPFCEVCIEAHLYQIYKHISPVKARRPLAATVNYPEDTTALFVDTYTLDPNTITVSWFFDGDEVHNGNTLSLDELSLESGEYTITAVVRDTSELARSLKAEKVMADSVSWLVKADITALKHDDTHFRNAVLSVAIRSGKVAIRGLRTGDRTLQLSIYTPQGRCICNGKPLRVTPAGITVPVPEVKTVCGMYLVSLRDAASSVQRNFKVIAVR